MVKFELYDLDSNSSKLSAHDFLGRIEVSLGAIVSAGQFVTQIKDGPSKGGEFMVMTEELVSSSDVVKIQFSANKLVSP